VRCHRDPSEGEQPGSCLSERSLQALTTGMCSRSLLTPVRMLVGPSLLKLTGRNEGETESWRQKWGRILILGVLPTLSQLQTFQGHDWVATQLYSLTPCPSVITWEGSALFAMHVHTCKKPIEAARASIPSRLPRWVRAARTA